ncbi:hypothetical protein RO07_13585 [Pandoraea pulmonicola]|uniref:Effector protein BipC n=1 Tax=Pandoraea pulmonicola TaxID=93221 RepID=A0ABM5S0J4_PANPU|nr:hypothetical protein RO07_13585 [Pandoraea pulmonicola]
MATVGVLSTETSKVDEKQVDQLRDAAAVARLDGGGAQTRGSRIPELREPRAENPTNNTHLSLETIVGILIAVILAQAHANRESISSNSKLELNLAASNAESQRSAGRVARDFAFGQAGTMMLGAGMSAQRAMKGANYQLSAARTDLPKANEAKLFASTPNLAPGARADFVKLREAHMLTAQAKGAKASMEHAKAGAIRTAGDAATRVTQGSESVAESGHRAHQAEVAGESAVANQTTQASHKDRAAIDDFQNAIQALRNTIHQSKDEAAKAIARSS